MTDCPDCDGNGVIVTGYCPCCDSMDDATCARCAGTGQVPLAVLA